MDFSKKLRSVRLATGLTQIELGKKIGVSSVAIGNWERGIKSPGFAQLKKLATELNTSVDYLMDLDDGSLSLEEKDFFNKFKKLDEYGKSLIYSMCDIELKRIEESRSKRIDFGFESKRYLPFYSAPSAAGFAAPLEGNDFEMLLVDGNVPRSADFAVRISGDSMEPYIHDGQMVFVRECERLKKGEVGIFCVDGAMYCKQYMPMDDKLCLYSANPERQEANVYITNDSNSFVKCCGKVLLVDDIPMPEL